ncbi:hypothetical protein EDB80DRAFT_683947 [Ilyonectria destructans]|nr:hypothetical protein EDB80DRAFT_683947 [Ilyonectria destructans]
MLFQTILIATVAVLPAMAAQFCGDSNLGGGCETFSADGKCHNFKKADWLSSYDTEGATCQFFDSNGCFDELFSLKGRDGNLRNGPYNDQVNSILCKVLLVCWEGISLLLTKEEFCVVYGPSSSQHAWPWSRFGCKS